MNADDLRSTIVRVEHDLKWAIWPHGNEARVVAGLEREDDQFAEALQRFEDACYALHPNTAVGVNVEEAARLVDEACDLLDGIPYWADDVNIEGRRRCVISARGSRVLSSAS